MASDEKKMRHHRILVLPLVVVLVAMACTTNGTTVTVPAGFIGQTGLTSGRFPVGIVAGPSGTPGSSTLWFTESGIGAIGRITTDTQTVTEYCISTGTAPSPSPPPCPNANSQPWSITAGAQNSGILWFTEEQGNKIGSITTNGTNTQTITEIQSYGVAPYGIVFGTDGNVWYTETGAQSNDIVSQSPAGGPATPHGGLNPGSAPHGIVEGPDHNFWFTESGTNVIGVVTTVGQMYQYCIPTGIRIDVQPCQTTQPRAPEQITAGPDGNLWFTEPGANRIGRLILTGSLPLSPPPMVSFSEYCFAKTLNPTPWAITLGPDGYIWFTEATGNKIGRINATASGTQPGQRIGDIREFDIPIASGAPAPDPQGIAGGPGSTIWFTERIGNQLAFTNTAAAGEIVSGGPCSS